MLQTEGKSERAREKSCICCLTPWPGLSQAKAKSRECYLVSQGLGPSSHCLPRSISRTLAGQPGSWAGRQCSPWVLACAWARCPGVGCHLCLGDLSREQLAQSELQHKTPTEPKNENGSRKDGKRGGEGDPQFRGSSHKMLLQERRLVGGSMKKVWVPSGTGPL